MATIDFGINRAKPISAQFIKINQCSSPNHFDLTYIAAEP